ncbi:hypothetical protein EV1_042318 [Malus domestica]
MEVKFKDEKKLEQRLEELHKDVSKKHKFEDAVTALNSLLRDHYSSASPSLFIRCSRTFPKFIFFYWN